MSPSRSAGAYTADRVPRITSGDDGCSQQRAVPVRVRLPGVPARHRLRGQQFGEGRRQLVLVAVVGHDQDRARTGRHGVRRGASEGDRPPPRPGARRQTHDTGLDRQSESPALGQRRLDRARRHSRGCRAQGGSGSAAGSPAASQAFSTRTCRVRDREAQHVVRRPRGPVGDGTRETPDLGAQHRDRRDERLDVAERARIVLLGSRARRRSRLPGDSRCAAAPTPVRRARPRSCPAARDSRAADRAAGATSRRAPVRWRSRHVAHGMSTVRRRT